MVSGNAKISKIFSFFLIFLFISSIFIGIDFISNNVKGDNITIPSGILYYVPINITNTQNISTPNPYQQMVQFNISQYSTYLIFNYSFANFEFFYANGTIIPAWIESLNNTTNIITIWLKLTGINANSSLIIYLGIASQSTNLLSNSGSSGLGEAPQLSSIYGQYDNGVNVFSFYDNFIGSSLNTSKWVSYGSISVSNGISINGGSNYAYIITSSGFNPQSTICDVYVNSVSNAWSGISMTIGSSGSSNGYFYLSYSPGQSNGFLYGNYGSGGYFIGSRTPFYTPGIATQSWQSGSSQIYANNYSYSNQSFTTYSLPSQVYYGIGTIYGSSNAVINIFWVHIRAYPPNGVMPSVSFGSIYSPPINSFNVLFNFYLYYNGNYEPVGFQGNIYTNASQYCNTSFLNINTGTIPYYIFTLNNTNGNNTFYFNFNLSVSNNNPNIMVNMVNTWYFAQVYMANNLINASLIAQNLTYYQYNNILLPEYNASFIFANTNVSINFIFYTIVPYNFYETPYNNSYNMSINSISLQNSNLIIYNTINYNTPQFQMNSNSTIWNYADFNAYSYINYTIYYNNYFVLGSSFSNISIYGNNSINVNDTYPYQYNYGFFDPYIIQLTYSGQNYIPYVNLIIGNNDYVYLKQYLFFVLNDSNFPLTSTLLNLNIPYQNGYMAFIYNTNIYGLNNIIAYTDPFNGGCFLSGNIDPNIKNYQIPIYIVNGYQKIFINTNYNNYSHVPSGIIYQVPIYLTNNQNYSLSNFQIMLTIDMSNYPMYFTGSFANFEFSYPNGSIIPAWIENKNGNTINVWLNFQDIIYPNSTYIIYLDIANNTYNLLNASGTNGIGENPLLSVGSTGYGTYDDGQKVFMFYDNFNGNNNNQWDLTNTSYNGTSYYNIYNGLTLTSNTSITISIMSKAYFNTSILEWYGWNTGTNLASANFSMNGIINKNQSNNQIDAWIGYDCNYLNFPSANYLYGYLIYHTSYNEGMTNMSLSPNTSAINPHLFGLWVIGNDILYYGDNLYINDLNYLGYNNWNPYPNSYNHIFFSSSGGITTFVQWVRVRSYTPNYPIITFGNMQKALSNNLYNYWNLTLNYSYYNLKNINNYKINSDRIYLILPSIPINIYATYDNFNPTQFYYYLSNNDEIINISFNGNFSLSQSIIFNWVSNYTIPDIPFTLYVYDIDNNTNFEINSNFNVPFIFISSNRFKANYNIVISNETFNVYYAFSNDINVNYSINYYPYSIYINITNVYGMINLTLFCSNIYQLAFNFNYSIYSSLGQSINITIQNDTNTMYANVSYIPINLTSLPPNNSSLIQKAMFSSTPFGIIELPYGSYTYLINSLNTDLAYIQGSVFLNQSINLTINPVYPILNINITNTNLTLPNNAITIYYYDNCVIYPYDTYSNYLTFNSSISNLTIPANVIIYINLTSININNSSYYPFLLYSIPNIIINVSNNYAYTGNLSGFTSLSFITYNNLSIYIQYSIPYFINLTFININGVYINYNVYNGYSYNNQTIFITTNYIAMPFPQYIYYKFQFTPYDQNYTLVPSFISGYLINDTSYTIIGILNPKVNTTGINNTLPSPYNFNWSIPGFIIFGYTSDYIFSITFVFIIIGIAVYTGYKLRSDLIPILILAIGLFLLYIVNLLPLWISILAIAGIFIFYYFLKRGEYNE